MWGGTVSMLQSGGYLASHDEVKTWLGSISPWNLSRREKREEIKRVPDNESITDYYWSLMSFIHGPAVSLN